MEIKSAVKNLDDSKVRDEDISNVVIGNLKQDYDTVVIGKKFGNQIKYIAKVVYKEFTEIAKDENGNVIKDKNGEEMKTVIARLYFLPFGFPINLEYTIHLSEDEIIPLEEIGENNTPDAKKSVESIKKQYISSLSILSKGGTVV